MYKKRLIFALIAIFVVASSAVFTQQPATLPTPVEVKLDPILFDPYVGQYTDTVNFPGVIFSFYREGARFFIRPTDGEPIEIFASSEKTFFPKVFRAEAEFVRDASGKAAEVIWRQGGRDSRFKKIADAPEKDNSLPYKRSEVLIPMRDGTKLYTVILTPENPTGPSAILMDRTPYGVRSTTPRRASEDMDLAKEGYVFVFQDIRGRYDSEGTFMMNRPLRDKRDPKSIDESTDSYDTIEWLVRNVPNNNGRVGIYGVSYDGWLAEAALIDPHPALKASSPQAPMTDTWIGDDFFHNGAWRQTYGHEYVKDMESGNGDIGGISFDIDAYDWYLNLKTDTGLTRLLDGKLPTYNAFLAHPAYDDYWKARSSARYLTHASVPTLVVGGWWDQEDMYGALATYKTLQRTDKKNQVFFVMGPWNHGGWEGRARRLGGIDFGSETGTYFKREIQAPFFACQLKNKCEKKLAEATIFQSGSNRWKNYDAWPPKQAVERPLYLQADSKLTFQKPTTRDDNAFDSYVSDPASPIPYRKRPIQATYDPKGSGWYTWLVEDQRFLSDRKDLARWETDVLTDDVALTGDMIAHLYASTTGSDSDWVVKLIDVYPDSYPMDEKMAGYQLMIAEEIFRGRYRRSWEKPEPISPNKVEEFAIDLRGNDHVFKKGHRIMVEVQSTWFPLYDRNPQKFVDNIFLATEGDYQVATQRIYRSAKYPSHVSVSVQPHS